MNNVNSIVFSKRQCRKDEDIWEKVALQLKLLTSQGYVAVVYDDDVDIIVIQFEHDDRHGGSDYWGSTNPYWLTPEQVEQLEQLKFEAESDIEEE